MLGAARHSETLEEVVVYRTLYGNGGLWVRPRAMFEADAEVGGGRRVAPVRPAGMTPAAGRSQMEHEIMTEFRVEFEPPRHGWIVMRMSAGAAVLQVAASAVPRDTVADLAGAIALILKGGSEATVLWHEEPGAHEFRFRAVAGGARLDVTQLRDASRTGRDERRAEVIVLSAGPLDLCRPFWRALRRLESAVTPAAYESAWGFPFPSAKLGEVSTLIRRGRRAADVASDTGESSR